MPQTRLAVFRSITVAIGFAVGVLGAHVAAAQTLGFATSSQARSTTRRERLSPRC